MTCGDILFVGGTFNRTGDAPPSELVRRVGYGLYTTVNGGTIQDLEEIVNEVDKFSAVIWMPNICNSETKFLPKIKEKAPHIVLISSKRNDNDNYTFKEIVDRALKARSQLLIEVQRSFGHLYFRLVDPLGNVSRKFNVKTPGHWHGDNLDLEEFRHVLYERIQFLLRMKRVGCVFEGADPNGAPQIDTQFLGAVKKYADRFHDLIHGENENPRFMGNASFRCTKGGFPSQRSRNGQIFVSRRNVDKRSLDADSFVAVEASLDTVRKPSPHRPHAKTLILKDDAVKYWGHNKPSVDTPVQVLLYQAFPNINYMLHAHVYHKEGVMTNRYVPCGDIREVNEIVNAVNDPETKRFIVNLKGHGSLIASAKVEDLLDQDDHFYVRPMPEETL
jgi:hypothetical protein